MASKVARGTPAASTAQNTQRNEPSASGATQEKSISGEEKIRCLAYEKWEAAGRPACDGVEYWLQAEQECTQNGYKTD
jgi:hypothetical protein